MQHRICFYCGVPDGIKEANIPESVLTERKGRICSCSECNQMSYGAILFETPIDKIKYMNTAIWKRYRKLLDYPDWSNAEIRELGRSLQTNIIYGMRKQEWIRSRLDWARNRVVLTAAEYLQNIALGRDSVMTAAGIAGMRPSEVRLLIELD